VTLSKRSHIEFIAGDTTIGGLQDLTAAIAKRANVYEADSPARDAALQLDSFVASMPEMEIPDGAEATGAVIRSDNSRFGFGGRYYLIPHTTVRGSRGVFIARAQGNTLHVAGITGADLDALVRVERLGAKQPHRPLGTPAQHVTAEIANTVAKYF
jgi:hypothetical protein